MATALQSPRSDCMRSRASGKPGGLPSVMLYSFVRASCQALGLFTAPALFDIPSRGHYSPSPCRPRGASGIDDLSDAAADERRDASGGFHGGVAAAHRRGVCLVRHVIGVGARRSLQGRAVALYRALARSLRDLWCVLERSGWFWYRLRRQRWFHDSRRASVHPHELGATCALSLPR